MIPALTKMLIDPFVLAQLEALVELQHLSLKLFLGNIKDAFTKNPALENLLLDDYFKAET